MHFGLGGVFSGKTSGGAFKQLAHVMPQRTIYARAAIFFAWLVFFIVSMALVGIFVTIPLFVIGYMRSEAKERWSLVLPKAVILTLFIYLVFDQILHIPWPRTVVAEFLPSSWRIPGM